MPNSMRDRTSPTAENYAADDYSDSLNEPSESFEEFFDEDFEDFEDDADFIETAFPEEMEADADWAEIHHAGFNHIDVARQAFPEVADADDQEVEDFLFQVTENMSPEEFESFWKGLAKFGRKALRVAAPVVQAAAPIVGTAVGAAFGGVGAPIGGAIGNLVGSGVGALNRAVNAPGRGGKPRRRRRSRRRTRSRRVRTSPARRQVRRRPRRRSRRRSASPNIGGALARLGQSTGSQVARLLSDPQIQNALLGMAQRGVGAIVGSRGESISESAAIAGLIGGLQEVLREAQESGHDLDDFDGDFAPEDFASAQDAFETLASVLGDQ